MKTAHFKTIVIIAISFFIIAPAMSQKGIEDGSKYGHGQDSIDCLRNLNLYGEYHKHKNYTDAIIFWRKVYNQCPASSEKLYVDGIKMYKQFLSNEKNPDVAEAYIDTIMDIYDNRIKYFNGEANVIGRKGIDLLDFRRNDIESVEEAYGYLKRSIDLDHIKAREPVVLLFVNSSIALNKTDINDQDKTIGDYFLACEIIDANLRKKPNDRKWNKIKNDVDKLMLDAGILTCEALNQYYGPKFEDNNTDEAFLNKMIDFYYTSGCDRSDLYAQASEQLYNINPSHESAYKLARLFVSKNDFEKSVKYYEEAVSAEVIPETKSLYYYELGQVVRILGNPCKSIEYGREAIKNNPNYGNAYILLGDAYIESRESLGEDFEIRTAFWAAADKYIKAKNVDPTVAEEANKRLSDYEAQYPDSEACFFRTLKEGDSYLVKGCINEYTTVRPRK